VILVLMGMRDPGTSALAFVAFFALFVNIDVGARIITGDPLFLGGKITHIGLALFFLGVIGSGKYADTDQVSLPRGQAVAALGYHLTFQGYKPLPDGKYAFHVDVQEGDRAPFRLSPVMFEAREQGLMRNPDIASFLTRDIYLSPISLQESPHVEEETPHTLEKGKELTIGGTVVRFLRFAMGNHASQQAAGAMTVAAELEVRKGDETESLLPSLTYAAGGAPTSEPVVSRLLGAGVRLVAMQAGMGGSPSSITFAVASRGHAHQEQETLIADVSTKPFINLLWVGTAVMMLGFVLSTMKRLKG
jgi:cytochrome c-type biogenesis protein CcmF